MANCLFSAVVGVVVVTDAVVDASSFVDIADISAAVVVDVVADIDATSAGCVVVNLFSWC